MPEREEKKSPIDEAGFYLRTLGDMELVQIGDDASSAPLLQRGKPLALLAYCTAERRLPHSRDTLVSLLWADAAPDRARHNARQAIWRLRRILGDQLITRDDAVLTVMATVRTDREQFLAAVARRDVVEAMRLYVGPFLPDVSLPGGDEFEEWAAVERRRLEAMLVSLVEDAIGRSDSSMRMDISSVMAQLLERAPHSLDVRRLAIDTWLATGDVVAARQTAAELEALAAHLERPLSPIYLDTLERARRGAIPNVLEDRASPSLEMAGRDGAFALAMSAWAAASRSPQILMFRGSAGVGKTRLLDAIARRCTSRRSQVVSLQAHSGEQDVPCGFAATLARSLGHLPGAVGVHPASAVALVALDPSLTARYAVASSTPGDGNLLHARALAVADLIEAVAEQQPLALVIDDWHWMDEPSYQILRLALERLTTPGVCVFGASRTDVPLACTRGNVHTAELAPLDVEELREAIRGSGQWPEDEGAADFIRTLAAACDGIPLIAVERLTLAMDRHAVRFRQGRWESSDWARARDEVEVGSPLTRRLESCTAEEQRLLLVMAVAGTPLSAAFFATASPEPSAALAALERKGFARQERQHWVLVHDVVAEHIQALSNADDTRAAHLELAAFLSAAGRPESLIAAVRHGHLGGDESAVSRALIAFVVHTRRRGDTRPVDELLRASLGDVLLPTDRARLIRRLPWRLRRRIPPSQLLTAAALLVSLTSLGIVTFVTRTPQLRLAQVPVGAELAPLYGPDAYRLAPASVLRLAEGDTTPREVRVTALTPSTVILSGARVRSRHGLANFGGIRVLHRDSLLRLRFEADGYRAVELSLAVGKPEPFEKNGAVMRLLSGRFSVDRQIQTVEGPRAAITTRPGRLIEGVMQMEYTAPWSAASVWMSMTPSWGDAVSSWRDLLPVVTPVRADVIDLPISVSAPSTTGDFWILIVMAAEPAGGFAASSTNWTVGRPVWGDGNDLAQLPDSVVQLANLQGFGELSVAYPSGSRPASQRCTPYLPPSLEYCSAPTALFGLRVHVR